jgi:predicted metal-binding membrane protein
MADGMAMPGGWTMSMAWMRMPGQTWADAAAMFMGMWIVMMVPMMLPSLVPMLSRYRDTVRARDERHLARLTALAGAGYFSAWTLFGACAYPLGLAVAATAMRWEAVSRLVPIATGGVLMLAGCVQLTGWKARQLARCRTAAPSASSTRSAWSHGVRLGAHCILCCSGLMAALLVAGVMDLAAMAAVGAAISVERLAPKPTMVARTTGILLVALGSLALGRAVALSV